MNEEHEEIAKIIKERMEVVRKENRDIDVRLLELLLIENRIFAHALADYYEAKYEDARRHIETYKYIKPFDKEAFLRRCGVQK